MAEPLLCIHNRHIAESGDPPIINDDVPHRYVGYFVGGCGDQWIFTFDRKTRKADLRGGDVGWEQVYDVQDGEVDDLILSAEESLWLRACWGAAAGLVRQA
jgi:hypothetical protein